MRVLGVDLAGSPLRETGICVVEDGSVARLATVYSDQEILDIFISHRPKLVAIDAPLSMPRSRLRRIEKDLRKLHIRFFPPKGMRPMEMLTKRAIKLKKKLKNVIEVYPGGAKDVLGIPRKTFSKEYAFLADRISVAKPANEHELDAMWCAWLAREHLLGKTFKIGTEKNFLVLPKPL